MSNFAELGLSQAALSAVERLGYEHPTPVQEQAIPVVLQGRDIIAAASTGTGKTAAFLLPTLSTLPRAKGRKRPPRILVISPTRELAQQISRTALQIARKTGHFVTTVYGGMSLSPQIRELRGGTDILIATPGRLKDLMARGVVNLKEVQTLVLDEADRMLDMGFLPDVTAIVKKTPDARQTLLFSATIDESIQNNLGSLLKEPVLVEIARNGETAQTVAQFIMPIKNFRKPELLVSLLEQKGSERVIVFCRTKNRTEDCAQNLQDAGFRAESIHSDKNQGQRRRALEGFRRNKTSILVATDVLARGIDVPEVNYVVNFDLPDLPEDYIHRIGRTGRAQKEGFAVSFTTRESLSTLREIEKLIDKSIPLMELEGFNLDLSVLEKTKKRGQEKRDSGNRRPKSSSPHARSHRKRVGGNQQGQPDHTLKAPNKSKNNRSRKTDNGKSRASQQNTRKHPSGNGPQSKRNRAPESQKDLRPGRSFRAETKRRKQKQVQAKRES